MDGAPRPSCRSQSEAGHTGNADVDIWPTVQSKLVIVRCKRLSSQASLNEGQGRQKSSYYDGGLLPHKTFLFASVVALVPLFLVIDKVLRQVHFDGTGGFECYRLHDGYQPLRGSRGPCRDSACLRHRPSLITPSTTHAASCRCLLPQEREYRYDTNTTQGHTPWKARKKIPARFPRMGNHW